jgi:hypothetical protein
MDPQKKVKIHNIGSTDVIVTMGQTDPAHIEIPTNINGVLKSSSYILIDIKFAGGCAKMYVWSTGKKLLWCGIVPLTSDTEIPLILNSDTLKVIYSGLELPECHETQRKPPLIERFGDSSAEPRDGIDFFKVIMIVVAIVIIYGLYRYLA